MIFQEVTLLSKWKSMPDFGRVMVFTESTDSYLILPLEWRCKELRWVSKEDYSIVEEKTHA